MDSSEAAAGGGPLTKRQLYLVFAGLMTATSLSALDTNIVGVALPTIVGDLGGLQSIAWVGTAYLLTSTAATPLFGKLSDLYGRLRLFQVAIVSFVIGSLACAMSQTMVQLVLARGLQGIGGGGITAVSFAVIGDVIPARQRGRYIGLFTSVFALGSVAGPLLGGFFVDSLNWRWIFLVNVPLGAVALVVTTVALKLPFTRHDHRIDYLGATLLIGAITAFILVITWGGEETYEWMSPQVIGMSLASAILGVLFVWWEIRAPEPILPMRLFRNQIFTVIVPMMIIMGSLMYGTNAFLPLYLQAVRGVSPTASGLLLVPLMLGVTAAAVVTGRITANTGRYRRWPILGSGMGVVGVALLTQLSADTPIFYTSAAMLILGLGMGMVMPTSTLAVQNSVEFRDMGVGTSMVAFFRTLGGAIGLAVYGALFNARLLASDLNPASLSGGTIQDLPPAALDALSEAVAAIFIVALPVTAIAFALSWFVKEIPLRETAGLGGAEAMVPGEPEAGLEIDAAAAALAAEGASPTTPSRAILH